MPRSGSECENLVLGCALPSCGAVLTKVPNATTTLPGGRTVRTRSPVDFMGMVLPSCVALVVDAKETAHDRLKLDESHFAAHQKLQLVRYGGHGAYAGAVVLQTAARRVHWLSWRHLTGDDASIKFTDERMLNVSSFRGIDWRAVVAYEDARFDAARDWNLYLGYAPAASRSRASTARRRRRG